MIVIELIEISSLESARRVPMALPRYIVNLLLSKEPPAGIGRAHKVVDRSRRRKRTRKKGRMKKSNQSRAVLHERFTFSEGNNVETVAGIRCNAIVWLCLFFVMIIHKSRMLLSHSKNLGETGDLHSHATLYEEGRTREREVLTRHTLRWIDFRKISEQFYSVSLPV